MTNAVRSSYLRGVRRDDDDDSPFGSERTVSSDEDPPRRSLPPWKIAVVDDENEVHQVTELALRCVSFSGRRLEFLRACSGHEARVLLDAHPDIALVLLDVVMETDDAGLMLVRHIREALGNRTVRVVLRTGQPGQAPEVAVIQQFDISDYRTKTELTSTRLLTTVVSALRTYQQLVEVNAQREELERAYAAQRDAYEEIERLKQRIECERDYLREEVRQSNCGAEIVGSSVTLTAVLHQVQAVARTQATVLLEGESGVGKELFARAVHAASDRAAEAMVKVNCACIPREIFESEFFGHVRGAFTGAHKDRTGRFQLADGGTLFLDEVGEIPLELQSKLLRALQEREVERIGDTRTQRVDVRVIAATNRDLKACVEAGTFRADLYYRLSVFPIVIPPLRERREDIVPLFEHFLGAACARLRRPLRALSPAMVRTIENYPWPGNVREMENVVERAVILSSDGVLRLDAILPEAAIDQMAEQAELRENSRRVEPSNLAQRGRTYRTAEELTELERENLLAVLEAADGKIAGPGGAAERLGVKPSTLAYQLKTFGITRR